MESLQERVQAYWDKRSADFSAVRQKELKGIDGAAWLDYIRKFLPREGTLDVLDIGTGPGFLAILMAAAGHRAVGMDMSPLMLKEAKKNSENYGVHVDFILGDAQMPPFEEASFDVIVSRNVTWNLPDVHGAYTGWYGLLRRGGVLLNFDSNYGPVDFAANAAEPNNVHNELDRELLRECAVIKDSLAISKEARPLWDMYRLKEIGFTECRCCGDIREFVRKDEMMRYDSEPLFCLYAQKKG